MPASRAAERRERAVPTATSPPAPAAGAVAVEAAVDRGHRRRADGERPHTGTSRPAPPPSPPPTPTCSTVTATPPPLCADTACVVEVAAAAPVARQAAQPPQREPPRWRSARPDRPARSRVSYSASVSPERDQQVADQGGEDDQHATHRRLEPGPQPVDLIAGRQLVAGRRRQLLERVVQRRPRRVAVGEQHRRDRHVRRRVIQLGGQRQQRLVERAVVTDPVDEPAQLGVDVLRRPHRGAVQRLGQVQVRAALQVAQVLQPLGDRRHPAPLRASPPTDWNRPDHTSHQHRRSPPRPPASGSPPAPTARPPSPRRPSPAVTVDPSAAATRDGSAAAGTRRTPATTAADRQQRRTPTAISDPLARRHAGTSLAVAVRVGRRRSGRAAGSCRRGPGPGRSRGSSSGSCAAAGPATPSPVARARRSARVRRRLVQGVDLRVVALQQRVHDLADPPQRGAGPSSQCTTRSKPCRPSAGRSPAACRPRRPGRRAAPSRPRPSSRGRLPACPARCWRRGSPAAPSSPRTSPIEDHLGPGAQRRPASDRRR